jgi:hypothetical protein
VSQHVHKQSSQFGHLYLILALGQNKPLFEMGTVKDRALNRSPTELSYNQPGFLVKP